MHKLILQERSIKMSQKITFNDTPRVTQAFLSGKQKIRLSYV